MWIINHSKNYKNINVSQGFTSWPTPNPYYNVIPFDGSIIVEFGYGCMDDFHTPMGKWSTLTNWSYMWNEMEQFNKEISEKFGIVEFRELISNNYGEFGPYCYLTRDVHGNEIPKPSFLPVKYGKYCDYALKCKNKDYDIMDLYQKWNKYWHLVKPRELAKHIPIYLDGFYQGRKMIID